MRVQVWGESGVSRLGEPLSEPTDVIVEPEGLVEHDDARVEALVNRRKVLGAQARSVPQGDLKPLSAAAPHN